MLWKKLLEHKVRTDTLWKGLSDRRPWGNHLFRPKRPEDSQPHSYYRDLYPMIIKDINVSELTFIFKSLFINLVVNSKLKLIGEKVDIHSRRFTVEAKQVRVYIVYNMTMIKS